MYATIGDLLSKIDRHHVIAHGQLVRLRKRLADQHFVGPFRFDPSPAAQVQIVDHRQAVFVRGEQARATPAELDREAHDRLARGEHALERRLRLGSLPITAEEEPQSVATTAPSGP